MSLLPLITMTLAGLGCTGDSGSNSTTADTPMETDQSTDTTDTNDTNDTTDITDTHGTTDPSASWAGLADTPFSNTGPRPRNLLMLSIDTLRRDRIGRYTGKDHTPFIDSLLSRGITLEEQLSCSTWTTPSVICALLGRTSEEIGFVPLSGDPRVPGLPAMLPPTLASWAFDAGFRTGLVSPNINLGGPNSSLEQGYETIVMENQARSDVLVDQALLMAFDLQTTGEPWFLHLHTMDPHTPYQASEEYLTCMEGLAAPEHDLEEEGMLGEVALQWDTYAFAEQTLLLAWIECLYEGELKHLDEQLSRFWAGMEAMGLLEDTLVVVWSDHGEQFFERGRHGHKHNTHAEEVRDIATFIAPGFTAGTWDGITVLQDLPVTTAAILGIPVPAEVTGEVVGTASLQRPVVTFHYAEDHAGGATLEGFIGPLQAVTMPGYRLLYNWNGTTKLYDTATDPYERRDICNQKDARYIEGLGALAPAIAHVKDNVVTHRTPQDPHCE